MFSTVERIPMEFVVGVDDDDWWNTTRTRAYCFDIELLQRQLQTMKWRCCHCLSCSPLCLLSCCRRLGCPLESFPSGRNDCHHYCDNCLTILLLLYMDESGAGADYGTRSLLRFHGNACCCYCHTAAVVAVETEIRVQYTAHAAGIDDPPRPSLR